jgi:hypothetical protein
MSEVTRILAAVEQGDAEPFLDLLDPGRAEAERAMPAASPVEDLFADLGVGGAAEAGPAAGPDAPGGRLAALLVSLHQGALRQTRKRPREAAGMPHGPPEECGD